ncbi:hypothetical protein EJ07DRAFT_108794 [Lizonia empirigonia]|nr:hypothetical protein EJ07DRAFT_108794 [Lizonia empirigonia]
MARPLDRINQSDIIFPHLSNTPTFSSTLSSLKRSALSITNRLTSITKDSEFVARVAAAYDLPLIANERCGSWYIPLQLKTASVYFKSTDGHMGKWAFSLRRLNLQLLDVVSRHGGCVVVDSTRRGKSMPDALSKTVPFWCCVINRAVFGGESKGEEMQLFTPPNAVSESEHAQMESRVDGFVQQFLDICKPDIPSLRSKLQKPLRPLWVTQSSTVPQAAPDFPAFHPVILCTASRRVQGAEASEGGYIQGAADDHEAWSHGLTPSVFWSNKDALLSTNEEDLPTKIVELMSQEQVSDAVATLVKPTHNLYVSASQNVDFSPFDVVVSCTPSPLSQETLKSARVGAYLHLACQTGKLGSRDLRTQLPALRSLRSEVSRSDKILICCPTGKDLAVGAALAYLCLYIDDNGTVSHRTREAREIDKPLIKQRLSWITTSNPSLNPSRTTLQSVNTVLMSSAPPTQLPVLKLPAQFDSTWTLLPPSTQPNPSRSPSPSTSSPAQSIFAMLPSHPWSFTRTLTSAQPTQPSGVVTGSATFTPTGSPNTLLYAEQGRFVTADGAAFAVRRTYVWELVGEGKEEEKEIHIRILFAPPSPPTPTPSSSSSSPSVSPLTPASDVFVAMDTLRCSGGAWAAQNRARHVCGTDVYVVRWRFAGGMGGQGEGDAGGDAVNAEREGRWWEVRYEVSGPKKEYVSLTRYEEFPQPEHKQEVV